MSKKAVGDLDAARRETNSIQAKASDPEHSVWVAANAGTGKTHVLTQRVLRILIKGTKPDRILCLTYTKAAAAEMSTRVFERLAGWVTATPESLDKALGELLGRGPTPEEAARARTLFATAIETPGGLKVQTIHAFCEQLLQRFPLEAGVPPGFEVLDDETTASLRREAIDEVLTIATRDRQGELGKALMTAVAFAAEESFDDKLRQALAKREWIEAAQRLDDDANDPFAAAENLFRSIFGVRPGGTREEIEADASGIIPDAKLAQLKSALQEGSANDLKMAGCVSAVIAAKTARLRHRALRDLLLTQAGEPKSERTLATKKVQGEHPYVLEVLQRAQQRFVDLDNELRGLDLVTATLSLLRISDAVLARYQTAKARRAGLDFDDLVVRTASLLRSAGAAEWVLYKLDGGLDHILVDESQDTSPSQWQIIEALANEFYAGAGQREDRRTVFAVGDEKQSIYSFQGAVPAKFAEMGRQFMAMAEQAGLSFARLSLTLSFRTVAPLLRSVDSVFADGARTPGVRDQSGKIRHVAHRDGHAGFVELWPTETWQDVEANEPWSPLDEASASSPAARLADRIARTIDGWLKNGERLEAQGRPVRAGDILILVRRRRPFAPLMVAALKSRGIPVAGADRVRTTEQIAVEDLIALGDFLVLPEDDLALATVLKSPLIGFDDEDLLAIAPKRKGTLWSALLDAAPGQKTWTEAVDLLKHWRRRADLNPPYEFYAGLLERDGGRRKLLERLGAEAADPIDEFLNLAITFDEHQPPSLVGFLDWLRQSDREIKRDMEHGRDEVRIMTVHGAKGLEAPIVFLPDTCSNRTMSSDLLVLDGDTLPPSIPAPFVWPVKGTSGLDVVKGARAGVKAKEIEEYNRLLYVAMTRPRDRLYIAGFEGRKGRDSGCWYDTMKEGLAGLLEEVATPDGPVMRHAESQTAAPEKPRVHLAEDAAPVPLPEWALRKVPREPHLAVPVAPSRFVPYEVDNEGDPAEPAGAVAKPERSDRPPPEPSPRSMAADNRFLRGTLTHALLEHLPAFPETEWRKAAEAFVASRGAGLSARQRASIVGETLGVLQTAELRALYGTKSRAEVPLAAHIPSPDGRHPPLKITGQIDRLAEIGDEVMIVDYKTNRPPPAEVGGVAEAYLYQLAAYRLAIQHIFPGKPVRAAILWTDGPRIMPIPSELLDHRQSRLWEMHPAQLDADPAAP